MLAAGMVDVTRRLEERSRRIGRVVLRVVAGPDRGKKIVRHDLGPDTVQLLFGGRNPDNDIVLTDEHASDVHFELAVGSDAVVLRDLGSTNGVRLHGIRVDRAWLTPNAVFQVGQSHISLEVADTVDEDLASDHQFAELHGRSVPMRELFARLEKIARRSELPQGDKLRVLIAGETGTGKELVARALHANSRRRGGPFVVRDCSTIPRELAESVLFGHARGSFTGADRERPGCFEEAGGGTLFLDEIGELPLELQAKLLRVLQEETVTRVGEHFTRRVDVRILCATHRDLQRMVSEGTFRQDLYFRLAGLQLRLPSLRERGDDVLHLADLFLRRIADETHEVYILHADVAAALCAHPWPGNVRELRAVLDRATVMADTGTITVADLGLDSVAPAGIDALLHLPLAAAVAGFERRYYDALLARHPTKVKAAAAAGITYEGLRQALRRLAATPLQP
jgi:DNA-binding NtrC family response regulator